MKLDYATLISPYPLYLKNIGHIKSPTLKEIWNPNITYSIYNMYLSTLLYTPQLYFENMQLENTKLYQSLCSDNMDMFDIIKIDITLQNMYCSAFNFFFEEEVVWNNDISAFCTYIKEDEEIIPVGSIHKDIFAELCDVILQRCAISQEDINEKTTVRSKKAQETLKALLKGRKKMRRSKTRNKAMELPNLISSLSAKSKSMNYTNIWDLTVYQFYDQFKREQGHVFLDIEKIAVAAHGNKNKSFKGDEWFTNFEDM